MKTTTLATIAIVTAMILITASTLASPALAISGSTSKKKKGSSDINTSGGSSTSSSTKGTKSTSSTSSDTSSAPSSSVGKQLKGLISCLTTTSKTTGTLPSRAQFAACESQSSFGTVGGSTTGGAQVLTTGGAQVTPGENPMCDATDKNINATESRVCGVPKTPSTTTTTPTSTTTEPPSSISPSLP